MRGCCVAHRAAERRGRFVRSREDWSSSVLETELRKDSVADPKIT
jgi:hypothetical protein